ncbi:MAG TPA: bifunctional precorrin-2 dehydrogenase/sirohydrochlorin ferrochelatase [Polyangiaceae bacterium]|nr:bifunctional precorrin-2 dehydrogenase/sirohydrochlorin ferrochelatase [Polyangiaceae bacterium]HQB42575.1 bifunctional precorrin-2 dehydrogenase/sirohydrochlorin ferrochelatase [Polyangiaceae bacterium]
MSKLFPLFLSLANAPVLVVGAGKIAKHKAQSLLRCDALVTMVAPDACEEVRAMALAGKVVFYARAFREQDVDGKRLVIAATGDATINETVMRRCRALGVWVNVVDDPSRCDFHIPAVVERGKVQVAISTGGASPALSRMLKEQLGGHLEPSLGAYVELVEQARGRIKQLMSDRGYEERRMANEAVLAAGARERLAAGDEQGARRLIDEVVEEIRVQKVEG